MDLDANLPVTSDYDARTEQLRLYSAQRYMELIEGIRPHVAEILGDPAAVHDAEPARIQAHASLLRFYAGLVTSLGALYRVSERPRDPEPVVPMVSVEEMQARLDAAAVEHELQAARMVEAAVAAALSASAAREQLSLEAARSDLVGRVAALRGR